jgi:hypothetical protein
MSKSCIENDRLVPPRIELGTTSSDRGFLNAVLGRQASGKSHSGNPPTAARFSCKPGIGLGSDLKEVEMTRRKLHTDPFSSDRSFPYVLVWSVLGAVVSLASVWLMTANSMAYVMVA